MRVITTNKRAGFEYFVLDKFVAGIELKGGEVKSIRAGHVSLNESFVTIKQGEAYIINSYIQPYQFDRVPLPERRPRKLLLNRNEIDYLSEQVSTKGLTIVPTIMYFEGQLVKVEIALCRGKLLHDKRKVIKERDVRRNIERELKDGS